MWKALGLACGGAIAAAFLGFILALCEVPRAFRPGDWRPYAQSESPLRSARGDIDPDADDLRPVDAWSPGFSLLLLALHLAATGTLAARAALDLRAFRALQRGRGARDDTPYRQAPTDPAMADRGRSLARRALTLAAATVLPCFTSMGEVVALRAAGVTVDATPTEIGWFQDLRRDRSAAPEQHAVRARAMVDGAPVTLESRCGFALTMRLDSGTVGPRGVPFVVWPAFPSVHQIGRAPVVGRIAGWAHFAFLAALGFAFTSARARRDEPSPPAA